MKSPFYIARKTVGDLTSNKVYFANKYKLSEAGQRQKSYLFIANDKR